MGMSSEERQAHRKYLEARIAQNRQRLKELFSGASAEPTPPPRRPAPPRAGMANEADPAAATAQAFVDTEPGPTPSTFPRSRTMRWAMEHPAEAAVVAVVGAAVLGMGPVQLARWLRTTKSARASASFMHGVREGVTVMQPLLPLVTAWLGHKWRSAERDAERADHQGDRAR